MKTLISTLTANAADTNSDLSYILAYSDGSSEIMKKSLIDMKAGTGGQNSIDRATSNKELYSSAKTMIETA